MKYVYIIQKIEPLTTHKNFKADAKNPKKYKILDYEFLLRKYGYFNNEPVYYFRFDKFKGFVSNVELPYKPIAIPKPFDELSPEETIAFLVLYLSAKGKVGTSSSNNEPEPHE